MLVVIFYLPQIISTGSHVDRLAFPEMANIQTFARRGYGFPNNYSIFVKLKSPQAKPINLFSSGDQAPDNESLEQVSEFEPPEKG